MGIAKQLLLPAQQTVRSGKASREIVGGKQGRDLVRVEQQVLAPRRRPIDGLLVQLQICRARLLPPALQVEDGGKLVEGHHGSVGIRRHAERLVNFKLRAGKLFGLGQPSLFDFQRRQETDEFLGRRLYLPVARNRLSKALRMSASPSAILPSLALARPSWAIALSSACSPWLGAILCVLRT